MTKIFYSTQNFLWKEHNKKNSLGRRRHHRARARRREIAHRRDRRRAAQDAEGLLELSLPP